MLKIKQICGLSKMLLTFHSLVIVSDGISRMDKNRVASFEARWVNCAAECRQLSARVQ